MKGYPFASSGSESVSARQLICRILESLREVGWEVTATLGVSRKPTDKSTFLLRRCESARLRFACLAPADVDRLRMLNFPPDMARHIRALAEKAYLPGVADELHRDASCHELELSGVPWTQNSSYSLHARSMLLRLLREAHAHGWRLAASADVSAKFVHQENGPDYPVDVDAWFFSYQVSTFLTDSWNMLKLCYTNTGCSENGDCSSYCASEVFNCDSAPPTSSNVQTTFNDKCYLTLPRVYIEEAARAPDPLFFPVLRRLRAPNRPRPPPPPSPTPSSKSQTWSATPYRIPTSRQSSSKKRAAGRKGYLM